jgi:hypothetical protein
MAFPPLQIVSAYLRPYRRLLAVAVAAAVLTACDQADGPIAGPKITRPNLQRYVTGAAAENLDAQGRFALAPSVAPGARPIITAEQAGKLALASVRSWGPALKRTWEEERGQSIDLESLRIGERILFARTPYGMFPDGYHPALTRAYGPYYLVTLYSGSQPVLLISVAAYNSEATINARGLVDRPILSGMEFISQALPADTTGFRIMSPEEAVAHAGHLTGARVTVTPELVRPGLPLAPTSAMWKLTLDRDLPVRVRGATMRVREVYVGPERSRRLMVPVRSTARVERTTGLAVLPRGHRIDAVEISIVEGESVSFEQVTPEQGGE